MHLNNQKNELYHHGVKGMKWGVRRYQNADGSLTSKGRSRYGNGASSSNRKAEITKNVSEYRKKIRQHDRIQDVADNKWSKVSEEYKALGKNRVTRIFNAARNKSDAAKKYNRDWEDWNRTQELADSKWNDEVRAAYEKTGRNAVARILNNINYDINKRRS